MRTMYGITKLVSSPLPADVVTLADLKRHPLLRINYTLDDATLQAFINTSLEYCERYTGRAIQANKYRLTFTADDAGDTTFYPSWIPLAPTVSIDSFKIDTVAFTDYEVDLTLNPARITYTNPPIGEVVEIEIHAGYTEVPPTLVQAVRQYAVELYLGGQDGISDNLKSILNNWRIFI